MKSKLLIISIFLMTTTLFSQNMWMWNHRTHPELNWQTLETEHFNIHFHQGIEDIARRGALIAEQVYQPTLDQLQVEDFGKTDIVFSAEDEIMNGFAMPSNQIFIWVSQNDVAGNFGGSEKWLKLVVTHEFQHVVQFQAHRTWAGVFGAVSIPSWWLEGMAEYLTEVWRVGRSDSKMKIHTYRNTMNQLNSHDDGYAKVLYLAWKYGDSTLVKISKHRLYLNDKSQKYPYWYDFGTAFEESTGQTLANFNEEWRRVMNTYYYGYKAQKETPEEIGNPLLVKGFSRIQSAALSPDSSQVAVVGGKSSKMRDYSLYIQTTDSSQQIRELAYGRYNGSPAWSPDSKQLLIAEYHRGSNGSLINDIHLFDIHTQEDRWITTDMRALHPVFSHDGQGLFFVAHPGETSQIYYQDITTEKRVAISHFSGDVQLQNLNLSPSGQKLAFMIQEENGDVNIASIDVDGQNYQKLTNDPAEDLLPVWTANGRAIIFTSYRNSTPNLYRVELDSSGITQMTDVAEGIYSRQRMPGSDTIIASTLADVDTTRIRVVSADRVAPELGLTIREPFTAWRSQTPSIQIPKIDYNQPPKGDVMPYRALGSMRPLLKLIWPSDGALLMLTAYSDALGKHLIQGAIAVDFFEPSSWGGYFSYLNLNYGPHINFFGMRNLAIDIRRSSKEGYLEQRNGLGLAFDIPFNTGKSLSSNHLIQGKIHGVTRNLLDFNTDGSTSQELNVGISYIWKSQRPHLDKYILPRDGVGFLIHAEKTLPSLWGGSDHAQYWVEGFFNYDIPKLPFVLHSRVKYVGQGGTILAQDELGFSESAPFYFSTEYMTTFKSAGIFNAPESYSLRGQVGAYAARDLIYSTSELRWPLISKLPVGIFGFSLKNFTGALYYDQGYIPDPEIYLSTVGAEVKFDVSLLNLPLVTLAYGWGGDVNYWKGMSHDSGKSDVWRDGYLRMALVNPF